MKILILTNNGMGLYKFRRELLKTLIQQKHKVFVSLPKNEYKSKLEGLGCTFIESHVDRRGTNPIADMQLMFHYISLMKKIKPDAVFTFTIKPNVYGGIACRITKTPYITNITGLGTAIEKKGLIQKLTLKLYKMGLKRASCVFFQNKTNRNFFMNHKLIKGRTRIVPGSGVNLKQYKYEKYPSEKKRLRFLFIGRIMKAKGIEELMQATKIVKKKYPKVTFDLVGPYEEDYSHQIFELSELGIVTYHGLQQDVQSFIKKSHAIIHPSYHEGTSNVLLESASSGRPILASNIPGCKETFDEGVSGFRFKVRNVQSLVKTIIKFINLPHDKKRKMGIAGRKKMEKEFNRKYVIHAYIRELKKIREKA